MSYTLKLGDTAALVFQNAINESQALAQLRSACPGLAQGLMSKVGWLEISRETYDVLAAAPIESRAILNVDNGRYFMRRPDLDEYHEPEIRLVEN